MAALISLFLLCFCFSLLLPLHYAQNVGGNNIGDCSPGQYYGSDSVDCSNDSLLITSGNSFDSDCLQCHSLCDSCYGPNSTRCYTCNDYYVLLSQGVGGEGELICGYDGFLRNSSLDVVQCVDECPVGSTLNNETNQCLCDQGYYQNGSLCSSCSSYCSECVNSTSSGCLRCSYARYQGNCVMSCPQETYNINGECMQGDSSLSLSRAAIIAIIASVSAVLLLVIITAIVVLLCCIWRARRIKNAYDGRPVRASVVISESFKQVSFNNRRRKHGALLQSNDSSVYLHTMRDTYDPHLRTVTINETDVDASPNPIKRGQPNKESMYVKMSPAPSQEGLNRDVPMPQNELHRRVVGPSLSHQPPPRTHPPLQSRSSEPPQEYYEDMTWGSQVNVSAEEEQDEEQGVYEDLSGGQPIVPPRGIRPAVAPGPPVVRNGRKETLDNQYVKMTKKRAELHRSTDNVLAANHSYVNVRREDQLRLRAITSPEISSSPFRDEEDAEPEDYVEMVHGNSQLEAVEESIYDN